MGFGKLNLDFDAPPEAEIIEKQNWLVVLEKGLYTVGIYSPQSGKMVYFPIPEIGVAHWNLLLGSVMEAPGNLERYEKEIRNRERELCKSNCGREGA